MQFNKSINYVFAASIVLAAFVIAGFTPFGSPVTNHRTVHQDTGGVTVPAGAALGYKMWSNSPYFINQKDSSIFLYLEARAARYSAPAAQRTPLNIALVLDRSGSMSGDKLEYCKKAAAFVIDNLEPADRVSIVIYDSYVQVLVPSVLAVNKQQIKDKIASIRTAGSTFMSGGMLSGYEEVKRFFELQRVNRVLLLTDGLANAGITDRKSLDSVANKKVTEDKISLSTFGVGADFDEVMLTELAEYGIGNYYFIDKPENIPVIFNKELKGLLEVVAQEATVTVELPAGVSLVKVFGYKYQQNGRTITIPFKDIFSEEQKSILLEVKLEQPTARDLVFKSVLQYNDAISKQKGQVLYSDVTLMPAVNFAQVDTNTDDYVFQQITIFKSNEMLEEAMNRADKGDFDGADKVLQQNTLYWNANKSKLKATASASFIVQDSINVNYSSRLKEARNMNQGEFKMYQKGNRSMNYKSKKRKG